MKYTVLAIIFAGVLIGGAFLVGGSDGSNDSANPLNNVSIRNGKQIIEIGAKGGYFPRITTAKADMPTIIKMKTSGTFDCSSAVSIPSINYRANLKPSGVTEIEIPPQKAGSTLRGLCAMGMYNFEIGFN